MLDDVSEPLNDPDELDSMDEDASDELASLDEADELTSLDEKDDDPSEELASLEDEPSLTDGS
jgi:hypothetical protein